MSFSNWPDCQHLKQATEDVRGLSFRGPRGPSDAETMSRLSHLSWKADDVEWMVPPEDLRPRLEEGTDREHGSDIVFAEMDGAAIGYAELRWEASDSDQKYYRLDVHLLPQWRGKGIREAMFRSCEERLAEISSFSRSPARKYILVWAFDGQNEWRDILLSAGYLSSWHLLEMVRVDLGAVKDVPAPPGLDLRPARPEDYPGIWSLFRECFAGEQWSSEAQWDEQEFEEWKRSKNFMPALWKIARQGEDVVGVVENYVDEDECRAHGKKVGHSHRVCVREDWRRKGLATYLITHSLNLFRDMGMDEVTLDTEVENKSRAMRVYMGVGFTVRRTFTFFVKPL